MPDPRNVHHDKRVQHAKKHGRGAGAAANHEMHRPGMKPHQQPVHPVPGDHGPDADEALDKVESGEER